MATISRTGIADGSAIQAEHIIRIIDTLDGTATTDIIATGSFTGSFDGIHTGTIASASYAVSASFAWRHPNNPRDGNSWLVSDWYI
jgi:hypothetical protein